MVEEAPPLFVLPQRSTRGKRMAALVGDELAADEDFWSHATWAEDASDGAFSSDDAAASDDADSDFDRPVEDDEAAVGEAEAELALRREADAARRARRRSAYVDPAAKKRQNPPPPQQQQQRQQRQQQRPKLQAAEEVPRALRESTKTLSARRERARAEEARRLQAMRARRAPSAAAADAAMTQEERLAEARETERRNLAELEAMLAVFEERRHTAVRRPRRVGGGVTTVSRVAVDAATGARRAETTVTFPSLEAMPAVLRAPQQPLLQPAQRAVCAVTGLPARYRDPLTGLPFANVDAFRALRARAAAEQQAKVDSALADLSMALEERQEQLQQQCQQ